MAVGRIINRALLQAASAFLNIEGVKQFPAELDLSDIKVVYPIGAQGVAAPGAGGGTIATMGNQSGIAFAGAGDYNINIVGAAAFNVGDPAPLTPTLAYRMDAIDFELILTAAAAIAANLREVRLVLLWQAITGDPPAEFRIVTLEPWVQIKTGRLSYRFALDGWADDGISVAASSGAATWNKRVDIDPSTTLILRFGFSDGGAAPAGVTFRLAARARSSNNGVVPAD